MFTYPQAKAYLIEYLTKDAEHQRAGQLAAIGQGFDDIDMNLPRGAGSEFDKLHIALNFWDSWQDARNHEWQYYPKIKRDDWPRLAMSIIADLLADRNIQDAVILDQFNFKK